MLHPDPWGKTLTDQCIIIPRRADRTRSGI